MERESAFGDGRGPRGSHRPALCSPLRRRARIYRLEDASGSAEVVFSRSSKAGEEGSAAEGPGLFRQIDFKDSGK